MTTTTKISINVSDTSSKPPSGGGDLASPPSGGSAPPVHIHLISTKPQAAKEDHPFKISISTNDPLGTKKPGSGYQPISYFPPGLGINSIVNSPRTQKAFLAGMIAGLVQALRIISNRNNANSPTNPLSELINQLWPGAGDDESLAPKSVPIPDNVV